MKDEKKMPWIAVKSNSPLDNLALNLAVLYFSSIFRLLASTVITIASQWDVVLSRFSINIHSLMLALAPQIGLFLNSADGSSW